MKRFKQNKSIYSKKFNSGHKRIKKANTLSVRRGGIKL